jgi:formamidopyrimidine-DNA glycosylase
VPELPEVETVRRGLEPHLLGRSVVDAGGHPSAKFSSAPAAIGGRIAAVGRRGKYLVFPLGDHRRLVIHLGMTGQLRIRADAEGLDPYGRAWWRLDDGHRLELRDVRRFGRVAVLTGSPDDHALLPTFFRLGPEPFDPAFDGPMIWRGLRSSTVRVKTQLLGQRLVAGVGNIYADEALWRAGIHPAARRVSRQAAHRLHGAIVDVLTEGIEHGGTTLRDYRTVDGGIGANQHRLDCYGRSGQPCHRCGSTLRRSVVDGRGTTHCPICQRR